MRSWDLVLAVEPGSEAPLYQRIAAAVEVEVQRGRLRVGERLPSSRALADSLGVNRNTVVAAFEALRRVGVIEGRSTAGTFVANPRRRPERPSPALGFDLPASLPTQQPAPRSPGTLLLLGGVPDLRLLPVRELGRAYARALRGARGRRALDYGDPAGTDRLRTALAELFARTRGLTTSPRGLAVVRGSQQGLYLTARALFAPGDRVAVETPGYPPTWAALRLAGAVPVPVPVDGEGLDVDALERRCAEGPLRAVVVTPHHQYPTTVTLSAARRTRLVDLARQRRLVVIEDDYDFEFHYDGPPVLPLAARAPDVVVYVATLSKTLAPGLRLGVVVGHPGVVARAVAVRSWIDAQGDALGENAVAELVEGGLLQRHARKALRACRARREALLDALGRHLPDAVATAPTGGMAVWCRVPGADTAAWAARAATVGVRVQAGGALSFDPATGATADTFRLGFAACTEAELDVAVARLASVRPR